MLRTLSATLLLVSLISQPIAATYTLVQDYSGDKFYQNFDFFTEPDPTNGHVQFQSMAAANDTGLAGFISGGNATNAIYMGVDATKLAPNGRGAVRVSSKQSFQHALVIADILHMPGGICGTWPAFWMVGPNWPNNGEIDIVEGVNDQTANIMTLHTSSGPTISSASVSSPFAGSVTTSNCDVNAPNQATNAGCAIYDSSNLTFGAGFNAASGGVYATEWTSQFIKIWFFPRGQIPADITSGNPVPGESNWGTPRSSFQGNFNLDDHFKNLQVIFDTTFCGAWAGETWTSTPSCAALAPTCEQYVSNNPQAFSEAYWAVNTLQVFQDDTTQNQEGNATVAGRDLAQERARLGVRAAMKRIEVERRNEKVTLARRRGGAVLPISG